MIERDPITLAKEAASLDMISNGRFVMGIGAGWNREEMENHGANYKHRWAEMREKVLAMKAIWTQDEPQFHGEYVNFDKIWSYPKPVQAGGPPIWIGANSKWVFDRVAEYADGWMPIGGMGSGAMAQLEAACEQRCRNVQDITLALFGAPDDAQQLAGRVDQGFNELIFSLPSADRDRVLPMLDKYAALAEAQRQ